uniref:Zinc finger CCHC domain-containing protein 7 n=1 Tax=Glossina brevipalpis TaxID=37001 RepID=A0A1A9W4B1_9MUSC
MDNSYSENTNDTNEMESLLYAQIHHEVVNENITPEQGNQSAFQDFEQKDNVKLQVVEANTQTEYADAVQLLSKRYWNSAKTAVECQQKQELQCNTKYTFVRNSIKNLNDSPGVSSKTKSTSQSFITDNKISENINQPNTKKSASIAKIRKASNRNLKLNPVAKWMERNKKDSIKTLNIANPSYIFNGPKLLKNGPFNRQMQKLEKHKEIREKKEKSKKARASATKVQVTNIIELVSDESDCSDVVMISVPSPPVITIGESDDENSKNATPPKISQKRTAVDCNDVQINGNCRSFLKPRHVRGVLPESAEKNFENSSRCTSACSIISSDDFIGQNDRSRLLTVSSGMADDEGLMLLTSDVDNLMHAQTDERSHEKEQSTEVSNKDVDFVPITVSDQAARKTNYRVDQNQFKALDVYESESDVADNIYAKGTAKPTVIREIDSSSESVEDISSIPKTKRLRKRKTLTSNKGLEINSDHGESTDDNEESDRNKKNIRNVSYIARGPAVEHYKSCKRLSTNAGVSLPVKTSKFVHAADGTRDVDFITILKNLVQDKDATPNDEADESDSSEGPTAREIAEKFLAKEMLNGDTALPVFACEGLSEVFEAIDENSQKSSENHVFISDENQIREITANGSPIYNIVYCKDYNPAIGSGWNEEMRKFYNESWNGEKFLLKWVLTRMNPDKTLWKIHNEDRFNKPLRRFKNLKCTNCCDFGHLRSKCKRPKKPMVCYMCGEGGHHEPRCPNTICLRCGNKTHVFTKSCNACTFQNRLTCPICNIRGHSIEFCPDKWRRYHSTTEPNVHPTHKNVQYNKRKYCCVCGARGHLSDSCKSAVRIMEYPVILNTVKSYQKSYPDYPMKSQFTGVALNLMYDPGKDLHFQMAKNTDREKYYGRFLNAVSMGYLLNSRIDTNLDKPPTGNNHMRSPILKAVSDDVEKYLMEPPNQVQEVSESGSVEVDALAGNNEDSVAYTQDSEVIINDDDDASSAVVCIEDEIAENIQLHVKGNDAEITDNCVSNIEDLESVGSNSNYSFSEHFQKPSASEAISTQTGDLQNSKLVKQNTKVWEMQALPDFIPLLDFIEADDTSNYNKDSGAPTEDDCLQAGISRKFIMINSDEENAENSDRSSPNSPCEAKIYLTRFHSKYLLSPKGHDFLIKTSEQCNLKVRLDWTSVGHVLIIFGVPAAQDKFHAKLLDVFQKHFELMHVQKFQNVPKRTDALIRFLRENIKQLLTNLGNVNELLRRVESLEKQQTKSGYKLVERARRYLNMILLGQAGLSNGSMHLDKLLMSLKTLINNHSAEDMAPSELRTEIKKHWMPIFTPYRHSNYHEMVETYNQLVSRKRLPKLNVDLELLGVFDTNLTVRQKQKIYSKQPAALPNSPNGKIGKNMKRKQRSDDIKLPALSLSKKFKVSTHMTASSKQESTKIIPDNDTKKAQQKQWKQMMPPPQAVVNIKERSATDFKVCYDTFLSKITSEAKNRSRNPKLSSIYWSRESLPILNQCFDIMTGTSQVFEKLKHVQTKAKNSQLSYTDYLAVAKLRDSLIGK